MSQGQRAGGGKRLNGKLARGLIYQANEWYRAVGSGLLPKVSAALLRNSAGFTSKELVGCGSGSMPNGGGAGTEPGWMDG